MSKAPFVLLINPWITDFAAHDLWTKPMGLLVLAALLREGGCGVGLIDCLDRRDPFTNSHPDILPGKDKKFGTGKYPRMRLPKPAPYSDFPRYFYRHGIHPESFRRKLLEIGKPDLIWITSIMTYWYPGVLEAVRMAREIFPGVPVWLGGIYARLCPGHAERQSGADRIITGGYIRSAENDFGGDGLSGAKRRRVGRLQGVAVSGARPAESRNSVTPRFSREPAAPTGALSAPPQGFSRSGQDSGPSASTTKSQGTIIDFGVTDFAFYDDALLLDAEYTLRPALGKSRKRRALQSVSTRRTLFISGRFPGTGAACCMRRGSRRFGSAWRPRRTTRAGNGAARSIRRCI